VLSCDELNFISAARAAAEAVMADDVETGRLVARIPALKPYVDSGEWGRMTHLERRWLLEELDPLDREILIMLQKMQDDIFRRMDEIAVEQALKKNPA
jgi:hypothetical protein